MLGPTVIAGRDDGVPADRSSSRRARSCTAGAVLRGAAATWLAAVSMVAERVHEVMRAADLLGDGGSTGALFDASLQEALRR